ncbi:MAG: Tol-Pal system beta propeller repeat protein TolB [candidate division KSB1 bacterium]|nr:Tol-Pal system beta propeller repeat protein TolB [candidate division KSB1 bacterium]MDZ7304501.1 Tol-Pal system beta propeller repeat protein TolB [candidate division KSB1 bacterium]MDZ7313881.1 Tol-Pal system beta propeller repeat protein TolB [candidate division KSB1 bacterium]
MTFVLNHEATAQTEVRLRAETKSFVRLPIEVKPCQLKDQATQELGQRVVDVLDNDLWASSMIAAYQTEESHANPEALRLEVALNRPAGPIRLAVQTVLSLQQKKITLEGQLLDSVTGKTLEKKTYRGCQENLRLLVHALADDIVNSLTGEKGIAKSRIAFTAATPEGKEIFVMEYDGTNQRQVTNLRTLNLTPAWSNDGRALVFTSYQRGNPDLFVLDLIPAKLSFLIKDNGLCSAPAWSPDGKKMAFVSTRDGNAEIYVMDIHTRALQRLTQHPAIDASPAWSPNGREIVFTSDRLGSPQIFLMDAEGSNLRRLSIEGNYNDSPAWSPRGDKIAFVSRGPGGFDIFTYDVTSETVTQLTANTGSNEDPCWSPDGYRLAFSSTRDGRSEIYTMMWDGTDVRRLTYKGTCTSPAWSWNVRPAEEFLCKE